MPKVSPLAISKTAASASSSSKSNKRNYDELSKDELVSELDQRDAQIAKLQTENKRLRKNAKEASTAAGAAPVVDPEKAKEKGLKLRQMAIRGIKSQMKWKPSCKHSKARFSWSSMCDEATFRAFRGMEEGDKKKGTGKMPIEQFENLVGSSITASIRYGYLSLVGENVNITFSQANGELKVTGYYGL